MATREAQVPDLLEVEVPVGGRVLVVSELHLGNRATAASTAATTEVARAIEAWTGPGTLIFNGGCLALLATRGMGATGGMAALGTTDPAGALAAHPALVAAVRDFAAGAGRRVVYLPGSWDSRAVWDQKVVGALAELLGAEIGLAAELRVHTGAGLRTVRVEPGHRLDPLTCPGDPRNPADSPLGQHLVSEVMPALRGPSTGSSGDGWLSGLDELDDPAAFPRFIASRLTYRRLARHGWWLLVPIVAAVLLRLPFAFVRRAHQHVASTTRIGAYLAIGTLVELILVAIVVVALVRGTWRALAGVAFSRTGGPGDDPNDVPRSLARDLVTAGHAGLITGHTQHPELSHLGSGFYANTGCASEVVSESPARLSALGMPSLFLAHRQVAWVELDAGNELHVRLLYSQRDLAGATILERLLTRPEPHNRSGAEPARAGGPPLTAAGEPRPQIVATYPMGGSWPEPVDNAPRLKRIRRVSATLVGLASVISLVSAFSEPLNQRLTDVRRFVPLVVPQTADVLVALAGVGLLMLARSIRKGQRRAWVICEGLLVGAAILHIVKGVDVEEALVAGAVAVYLFINRDAFTAGVDRPSTERGIVTLATGVVTAVLTGTVGVEVGTLLSRSRHHQRLPLPRAFVAASERLVGLHTVALPDRMQDFLDPAMLAVAIGLALAAAYLCLRPVVARRAASAAAGTMFAGGRGAAPGSPDEGLARAREIVRRHGAGTLDYFALRSDKQFFFSGHGVVAYAVYGGVCLVSPDPIGPVAERDETWKAFRAFADKQGWSVAVLGAGEEWLPLYRASGMHDLYLGDEAVVDCTVFTMEGGRYKGLRQAVNRIARYGYSISFHDPARIEPALREQLEEVMTKSRRGDVERGFSMTLGRAFDPSDDGLLLAVVHGPVSVEGTAGAGAGAGPVAAGGNGAAANGPAGATTPRAPVAFCQYVPAPGIDGFSLDLMRRDDGEHPNGLLDFAVVETIRHLKDTGRRGLGLNFATMRAVLAGEAGEGLSQRIQAWLLRRMSDSMQIESLWKFNAKYDPQWQPRYAMYDSPESALPAAIAVARAESFWELPVIGRFLVPSAPAEACGEEPPRPGNGAPAETVGVPAGSTPSERRG